MHNSKQKGKLKKISPETDLRFHYYMVTPNDQNDFLSPYLGYTDNSLELPLLINAVLSLPASLISIGETREDLAKYRLCASHLPKCVPLLVSEINKLQFNPLHPYSVFLSSKKTDKQLSQKLEKIKFPHLHLDSQKIKEIIKDPSQAVLIMKHYAIEVANFLHKKNPEITILIKNQINVKAPIESKRVINKSAYNHSLTIPNETTVRHLGAQFKRNSNFNINSNKGYLHALRVSALTMKKERDLLLACFPFNFVHQTTDLIISCPGLIYPLTSTRLVNETTQNLKNETLKKAYKFFTQQKDYNTNINEKQIKELFDTPEFSFFLERWQREISVFTEASTFQSFIEVCPVIRLPRKLYQIRGTFIMLGKLLRDDRVSKRQKINKLRHRISDDIEKVCEAPLKGFLNGVNKSIRVCADIPIGWLRNDGIPLVLRHYVSYIPTTPGNLYAAMALKTERVMLPIESTQYITIIRSFKPDDPLRKHLELSINEIFEGELDKLNITFTDVSNHSEFVDAVKQNNSPFLIFDGHGSHSSKDQVGYLHVGNDKIDTWSLKKIINIPPIVILSCCDACPVDRSHASSVNGFLASGAMSVLAPIFPVTSVHSAIMIARLLFRLTTVAKLMATHSTLPITWAQIVTSQLRANYMTDLLIQLKDDEYLNENDYIEMSIPSAMLISNFNPNWFEKLKMSIIKKLNWDMSQFNLYLEKHFTAH